MSALSLLVLRVLADNHDFAFSLYDFALFANLFNGWFNLHFITPFLSLMCCVLLRAPCDTSLVEVIYRHLNSDLITGQNTYIIHSQLSGYMSRYYVLIRKLDLEGGVRHSLNDSTLKLYYVILWQNNPSSVFFCVIRAVFRTACFTADAEIKFKLLFNFIRSPVFIDQRGYDNSVACESHGIFIMCGQFSVSGFYRPAVR